jgi:hypothetical protein
LSLILVNLSCCGELLFPPLQEQTCMFTPCLSVTESTMFWSPAKISVLWRFTDLLLHQWAVMPQQFSLPKPLLLHNLNKNFLLVECLCDVSLEDCCRPNWLWSGA